MKWNARPKTVKNRKTKKKHNVNQWTHNINNNKKIRTTLLWSTKFDYGKQKIFSISKEWKKNNEKYEKIENSRLLQCFVFVCLLWWKIFYSFFFYFIIYRIFCFFFTKRKQKVVQFNEKRQQNKLFFYFRFSTKDLLIHFIGGGSHFFLKWINILGKHGTYTNNNNNNENENENGEAAKIKQTNMVNVCVTKLVNKQTNNEKLGRHSDDDDDDGHENLSMQFFFSEEKWKIIASEKKKKERNY